MNEGESDHGKKSFRFISRKGLEKLTQNEDHEAYQRLERRAKGYASKFSGGLREEDLEDIVASAITDTLEADPDSPDAFNYKLERNINKHRKRYQRGLKRRQDRKAPENNDEEDLAASRQRNTHLLLVAWKDLLEQRRRCAEDTDDREAG